MPLNVQFPKAEDDRLRDCGSQQKGTTKFQRDSSKSSRLALAHFTVSRSIQRTVSDIQHHAQWHEGALKSARTEGAEAFLLGMRDP